MNRGMGRGYGTWSPVGVSFACLDGRPFEERGDAFLKVTADAHRVDVARLDLVATRLL